MIIAVGFGMSKIIPNTNSAYLCICGEWKLADVVTEVIILLFIRFCQIVQNHLIFMTLDTMEQQISVRLICYKEENRCAALKSSDAAT